MELQLGSTVSSSEKYACEIFVGVGINVGGKEEYSKCGARYKVGPRMVGVISVGWFCRLLR